MLMLQIAFLLQLDKNVDGTLPLTSGNKLSSNHLFPLVSYLSFSTTVFKSLLIYVVLTKTAEKYFNWGILLLSHEEDLNAQNYCVAFCFTGKEPQMHYYCSQLYFFNAVYTLFFLFFQEIIQELRQHNNICCLGLVCSIFTQLDFFHFF